MLGSRVGIREGGDLNISVVAKKYRFMKKQNAWKFEQVGLKKARKVIEVQC